jgi:hypothetical protein
MVKKDKIILETIETKLPETSKILKKMFKMVNVKWDANFVNTPDWYLKHEWSGDDYEKFKQWTINHLYTNKNARDEIMAVPCRNKEYIEDVVSFLLLNYSWKIKETKKDKVAKPKGLKRIKSTN